MKRGEVWWAYLPAPWGRGPVLLLTRDEAYAVLTWVMVAPLTTTTTTYRDIPTAVPLEPNTDGIPQHCVVSLDNIQAIRKTWLESRIVDLRAEKMQDIEDAIHFALGLSI